MKGIAFTSFKGGAGKSTAAMALASAYVAAGSTVTMIDADENAPLFAWRDAGRRNRLWDEACEVLKGNDLRSLEQASTAALDRGSDIVIVDTRGGGSEINNTIMGSVDMIVVPTALTNLDIAAGLETFEYAARLLHDMGLTTPLVLLVQRVPVGKLTVSQTQDLAALSTLPRLNSVLHARDAFGAISKRGLLHLSLAAAASEPRTRLMATHLGTAMNEARDLQQEIADRLAKAAP